MADVTTEQRFGGLARASGYPKSGIHIERSLSMTGKQSSAQNEYDLFVSYSQADRAWVEGYLLDALDAADLRVLSEVNFALGAPRILEFERAIKSCKRTLLVLSPAYMAEGALQLVDVMIQHYGLESGTWPVIPLLLRSVELPPRLAFLVALDATDPENWTDVIARLCGTLKAGPPASALKPTCPYPGMRAFREQEATHFYGREPEIEKLVQRLRWHPFVAIVGPSGSGKSSLVSAGLVPALRRSTFFGTGGWLVKTMRPGARPMTELATVLGKDNLDNFVLADFLAGEQDTERLLLVVDQYEEAFTQGSAQKEEFFAAIQRFISLQDCYAVISVRSDFFDDLVASPIMWPSIQAHYLVVAPLGEQGLRDAIAKPAENVGVFIESALVERLTASSAGQPGLLPFVQEVMVRLWDKLERRYLPLRAYEALVLPLAGYSGAERSGIVAAMAQLADEIINQLTPEQQRIAQRTFLRLVQFGEGRSDTRRQQPVSALVADGDDVVVFDETLRYLTDNRLLVLSGEPGGAVGVDLAHEAMLTEWPLLANWVKEHKATELTRRRLEAKAEEWVRLGRGEGGLLDKTELHEAEEFIGVVDRTELGMSSDLLDLIASSMRAINPGWHPRGLVGLVTLALTVTALVAFVVLHLLTPAPLPSVLEMTMCAATLVLSILAVIAFWLLRRADRFMMQRWTQTISMQKHIQVVVFGTAGVVVVLWGVLGLKQVNIAKQCKEAGFDAQTRYQLAILNENIEETPYVALFAARFERISRDRVKARATLLETTQLCRGNIAYTVVLREEGRGTPDAIYIAEYQGDGKSGIVQGSAKEACRTMMIMPYEILARFGLISGGIAEDLTDPGKLNCIAALAYEEGLEHQERKEWILAERKYREAISEYDRYVEAHMNLGIVLFIVGDAYEAVKEELIAVQVSDFPSAEVYWALGNSYYYAEDLASAKEAWENALKINQKADEIHDEQLIGLYDGLGVIYRELHLYDQAAEMFDKSEALLELDEAYRRSYEIALAKNRGILAFYRDDIPLDF